MVPLGLYLEVDFPFQRVQMAQLSAVVQVYSEDCTSGSVEFECELLGITLSL